MKEKQALTELVALQKAGVIVIRPADKGSGICILDREDYMKEAERHINDTLVCEDEERNYYKKVCQESIQPQNKDIKTF